MVKNEEEGEEYGDEELEELGAMAVGYYAILESAFRFNKNISIGNLSDFVAEMYAYFSKVASRNKDAWTDSALDENEVKNITQKKYQGQRFFLRVFVKIVKKR